jgi:hypothetical protein
MYFRRDAPPFAWDGPFDIGIGEVSGNPALVQDPRESRGRFELVVPRADGGLAHYARDNQAADFPWSGPVVFGEAAGMVDAVALIQSTFSAPGTLEVIARTGDRLVQFFRDAGSGGWAGPFEVPLAGLPDGAVPVGIPAFIQSRFGTRGNYEVVTPLSTGGMAHVTRNNDAPDLPWSAAALFGSGLIDAAGLFQSNYGTPGLGNLEVAARIGNRTEHYFRPDTPGAGWSVAFPGVSV